MLKNILTRHVEPYNQHQKHNSSDLNNPMTHTTLLPWEIQRITTPVDLSYIFKTPATPIAPP
ncbi:MAG: hypothetical protein OEM02_02075 [Desulfobulbaceae bacterium]|nr:hypothetical protein [Desulfobulbaceae bacterium]